MPSFNQKINNNGQFIVKVKVFLPCDNEHDYNRYANNANSYLALVDTGANTCSISEKIVTDLELKPHSQRSIMTAGKPHDSFVYLAGLTVPVANTALQYQKLQDGSTILQPVVVSESSAGFSAIQVTSFPDVGVARGFDLILGMDMLLGYHITIHNGIIIISI